eukprot:1609512-Amphidinium_carterae.1
MRNKRPPDYPPAPDYFLSIADDQASGHVFTIQKHNKRIANRTPPKKQVTDRTGQSSSFPGRRIPGFCLSECSFTHF